MTLTAGLNANKRKKKRKRINHTSLTDLRREVVEKTPVLPHVEASTSTILLQNPPHPNLSHKLTPPNLLSLTPVHRSPSPGPSSSPGTCIQSTLLNWFLSAPPHQHITPHILNPSHHQQLPLLTPKNSPSALHFPQRQATTKSNRT
jgi:hypothetical protein